MTSVKYRFRGIALLAVAALASQLHLPPAHAAAPSEVAALMHIRALIATADHDYKGHRIAALHAVEDACRSLGINIHGDGHDHTLQGNSDSMLREAGKEIDNMLPVAQQNNQPKVVEDLEKANKRLAQALAVK